MTCGRLWRHGQTALWLCVAATLLTACMTGRFKGTSSVGDPPGDAARALNYQGHRPSSVPPGVDLSRVSLTARRGHLIVTFEAMTSIPTVPFGDDPLKGPAWFLRVWNDRRAGPQTYVVGTTFTKPGDIKTSPWTYFVIACEGNTLCRHEIKGATAIAHGNSLTVDVPLSRLPKLEPRFTWLAGTFWSEVPDRQYGWGDDAPNQPQSADKRTVRPQDRASFGR